MEPLAAGDPRRVGVYRLRARLGAGGMGRVFLGFSPGGRAVAVKVVHPELARDPEFIRRFGREVRAAEAVGGVYTAPVVAHGLDDDPPWIATVFIAGPTLADVVEASGPLPEQAVWRLAGGLAEALQAIHGRGLVHRDLKPANVLLAVDGPRVIDFGISRALEGTVLTGTGGVLGTPAFMSPEQVTGRPAGPASDIFALGSVLAFAASGRAPFAAADAVAMAYQIVHAEPELTGVPDELRDLVTACLVKEPARRPGLADIIATVTAAAEAGSSASFWPSPVAELVNSWQDRLGPAAGTPQPVREPTTPAVSADPGADIGTEPTRTGNRDAVMAAGAPGPAGPWSRKTLAIVLATLATAAAVTVAVAIALALGRHRPAVASNTATRTPARTSTPRPSTPKTSAPATSAPATHSATASTTSVPPAPVLTATVCTHPGGCGFEYSTAMQVSPPDIYFGAGNLYIKGIAWSKWGYPTVIGYGRLEQNNCKPDCAQGSYYGVPAQITLSALLRYGSGPPAYAKMVISAPTSSFGNQTFTQGMVP